MLILGYEFYSDDSALDFTPAGNTDVEKIALANGLLDEIYLTNNVSYNMSTIPTVWDYDTVLHGFLNDSLTAGNVDYTVSEITSLRLKRREVGTYEWVTLAEFPVSKIEDFMVTYIDRYVGAGINTEYMLVAVSNNVEGSFNNNTIKSNYDGIVISEKDTAYRAFIYDYTSTERNQLTNIVTPLKGRFPFVIRNGDTNYTSGRVHAGFLPLNGCEINMDYLMSTRHREELTDFLTNGKPKLLKLDDGRSWIVNIVDNIVHSEKGALFTDFSFVQTGDALSSQDLYYADLIDVNL